MYKYALGITTLLLLALGDYNLYKAQKGDSFYKIGQRFHINYKELVRINDNARLKAGQVIRIPGYYLYKIRWGDNWYKISMRVKVKIKEIKRINPGVKRLYAKRFLKIPLSIKESTKAHLDGSKPEGEIPAVFTKLRFVWPVNGRIKNKYGVVNSIMNYGLVFSLNRRRVVAAETGTVIFTGTLRGMGRTMIIRHLNDFVSVYAGLEDYYYTPGKNIARGKAIGSARGREMFFSIFNEGNPNNPIYFLIKSQQS